VVNWREHIHSDPAILDGKPAVRGTRLGAAFLLGLFASGWTREQVLESYPQLTPEALHAVFAFASEAVDGTPMRWPGSARGLVHMADDFDATPEDFDNHG
jgi:uncharacterized protein (DUF433 family)